MKKQRNVLPLTGEEWVNEDEGKGKKAGEEDGNFLFGWGGTKGKAPLWES
jgi:hypothetical protein